MKTKIKVHETNRDHHGYIEWIEKLGLGYLPVEDWRKRRKMTKDKICVKIKIESYKQRTLNESRKRKR